MSGQALSRPADLNGKKIAAADKAVNVDISFPHPKLAALARSGL
jgi:hypothetical protein